MLPERKGDPPEEKCESGTPFTDSGLGILAE